MSQARQMAAGRASTRVTMAAINPRLLLGVNKSNRLGKGRGAFRSKGCAGLSTSVWHKGQACSDSASSTPQFTQ